MNKKKILYIIGTGRSGTTLLEILLGNAESVFNAGELNRYPKRMGIPPQHDKSTETFLFWEKIYNKLNIDNSEFPSLEKLHYKFEYHSGLLKRIFGIKSKNYQEYQNYLKQFFHTLYEEIDESIITDSSKYPGRALCLSETLPNEICYIYIKRDPVNVVRSFAKKNIEQPSKSWVPANLYYFGVNSLCKLVMRKLQKKHKVIEVTYEELINNPQELILKIEEQLEIDLSQANRRLKANQALSVGKLFDGNRIRMQKEIYLKPNHKKPKHSIQDRFTRLINYHIYH